MGKEVRAGYRYSKSHEWLASSDDHSCRVGLSDHAQESLGDITYFECPAVGRQFRAGEVMGFVESVKAVSDIFAPVDIEITQVNKRLQEQPELCNQKPYSDGWVVQGTMLNPSQVDSLMDAKNYEDYLEEEH